MRASFTLDCVAVQKNHLCERQILPEGNSLDTSSPLLPVSLPMDNHDSRGNEALQPPMPKKNSRGIYFEILHRKALTIEVYHANILASQPNITVMYQEVSSLA